MMKVYSAFCFLFRFQDRPIPGKALYGAMAVAAMLVAAAGCNAPTEYYKGLGDDLLHAKRDSILADRIYLKKDSSLSYHNVRVDQTGAILPWYSSNLGESYDKVIGLVWNFWDKMELDSTGEKYYMHHQVWRPGHDKRGLGGDQIMMAMSSWDLLYDYTGNKAVLDNMRYMADYYLSHGISAANDVWPNIPYPYNTDLHSGVYDGDMILGRGFLQPDKAGSFGYELLHLYKKTGDRKYLNAAVKIANTLAQKAQPGDEFHSPWPFKVNAETGETGKLINHEKINRPEQGTEFKHEQPSVYATNWTPSLRLFAELKGSGWGDTTSYENAYRIALDWLMKYPAKNNKWGPFFEDILGWSDCQINAITYAMFLMDNETTDPNWKTTVKDIFNWVRSHLDDSEFVKYGVVTTDEQTIYRTPGNSHSSRQASMELRYWEKTGDTTRLTNAIRQLNWATYMVNDDGKNYYIRDDIWLTDGYGDYVRHYLRSMAAAPELAPDNSDHMLRSSSVVTNISYTPSSINYNTFDKASSERFRLRSKPSQVTVDNNELKEAENPGNIGWTWRCIGKNGGGVLDIWKAAGKMVTIQK